MSKYQPFLIAIASLLTSAIGAVAADQSGSSAAEQTRVTEAMRSFFAAATADDLDKLHAVTTPDFYAFDAGGRFTRDALMDLIKAAHAAGKVYVWTVNEPEVHISGDIAWITYVNHGSIKDANRTKDVTWLESACLQREQGNWRIHFFHSTRVPEKKMTGTPMLNFPVVTPSSLQARAPSAAAADLASR
jgi:ketosteroid isomerase-like protein